MKHWAQRRRAPTPELLEHGSYLAICFTWDTSAPGAVFTRDGLPRYRFEPSPKRSAFSFRNLLRKPDFVVLDPEARELLRIRRQRRLPPEFEMVQGSQRLGQISLRSPLRNKYAIAFADGTTWFFHMPLYRIHFRGESSAGGEVWVQVGPRKRDWLVLLESHLDSVPLLSALAFIQREWFCYS